MFCQYITQVLFSSASNRNFLVALPASTNDVFVIPPISPFLLPDSKPATCYGGRTLFSGNSFSFSHLLLNNKSSQNAMAYISLLLLLTNLWVEQEVIILQCCWLGGGMCRRCKMDSHTWLELGTGCWLGAQLEWARGPQFFSTWVPTQCCLCFLIVWQGIPKRHLQNRQGLMWQNLSSLYWHHSCCAPLAKASHMAKPRVSAQGDL